VVQGGIPSNFRNECWSIFLGVRAAKLREKANFSFEQMVKMAATTARPKSLKDISKDLRRTFPSVARFREGFLRDLWQVLSAFAVHDRDIGYCQGLNYVAGGLLVFMEAEVAFYALTAVVERILVGYFQRSMFGLLTDTAIFSELLARHLPELAAHFDAVGVSILLLTSQWFSCLYIKSLPPEAAFRCWDLVLSDGAGALFVVALRLLRHFSPVLMAMHDDIDIVLRVNTLSESLFDFDELLQYDDVPAFFDAHTVELWRVRVLEAKIMPSIAAKEEARREREGRQAGAGGK